MIGHGDLESVPSPPGGAVWHPLDGGKLRCSLPYYLDGIFGLIVIADQLYDPHWSRSVRRRSIFVRLYHAQGALDQPSLLLLVGVWDSEVKSANRTMWPAAQFVNQRYTCTTHGAPEHPSENTCAPQPNKTHAESETRRRKKNR
jgi:hypothetical protein